jgi:hypothetical protein
MAVSRRSLYVFAVSTLRYDSAHLPEMITGANYDDSLSRAQAENSSFVPM